MDPVQQKYAGLRNLLTGLESVLVAFSGGVDSTLLLRVARDTLGDRALAVTAASPLFPVADQREADHLAELIGGPRIVINTSELLIPGFSANPPDRCYLCKRELFRLFLEKAGELGLAHVADGSNLDDLDDYRPGLRALKELGVLSPLRECGLTKLEIRLLSRQLGLPSWDKPARPCLATRLPYGVEITAERLAMVERCEEFLRARGFLSPRVRFHGNMARVEVEIEEMPRILDPALRGVLVSFFKSVGFAYISLDLAGFQSGGMNDCRHGTSLYQQPYYHGRGEGAGD